jgi:hypothetical protein
VLQLCVQIHNCPVFVVALITVVVIIGFIVNYRVIRDADKGIYAWADR